MTTQGVESVGAPGAPTQAHPPILLFALLALLASLGAWEGGWGWGRANKPTKIGVVPVGSVFSTRLVGLLVGRLLRHSGLLSAAPHPTHSLLPLATTGTWVGGGGGGCLGS